MLITNARKAVRQTTVALPLSSTRTGVVAALPAEGGCLAKQRLRPGDKIVLSDSLHLQLSGIGPERAHRAAENLLSTGAKALISWGVAGGLAPHLKPGVLLLPEQVRLLNGEQYGTDPCWLQSLLERLEGTLLLSSAPLQHTEAILSSPEEKARLYRQTGCVAVDMESAAVGKAAASAGVPFLVIRAIADPAQTALPPSALKALDSKGQLQLFPLLANLLKRPWEMLDLWQLARYFQAARATLRTVVARIGPTLLAP
ncbi:purine phosphorylase [Nitrosococcus watsonii]|uniref:Hopanoid-associated phosphorylase n=1 Tax=Nitrosococcus watsoni (strain C-113) TaxID=105559 RepID=D8K5F6_NITWC|nr:purine phosphorylase [Nitrosococcus watsonii]ADJ28133.1 hopanoid-associated phosphorylase [Nitrosococcus watsonii C-113]